MTDRRPFAFLVHPRTDVRHDLATNVARPFGLVPNRVYDATMHRLRLPPVVLNEIRAVDRPQEPLGWVVMVPLTPRQLLTAPRDLVRDRVTQAIDKAVSLGAGIVGLGALTAPVTSGGSALRHRTDVGVTNGNAFTAHVTMEGISRLLAGHGPGAPSVALVGATGSVGSAVTRLVARDARVGKLLLVGRSEARLRRLANQSAPGAHISTDMADVRESDLVVLMTSAADALLRSEHLKRGAVVLDDTQPRGTDPSLVVQRPDVTVLDGGIVATPGLARRGGSLGLPEQESFACLAETALLALDGHEGHHTLGAPTDEHLARVAALAEQHADLGFGLAAPRSFGVPRYVPGWDRVPVASAA